MTAVMKSYTLDDFSKMMFDNASPYVLPTPISDALKALSLEIGIPAMQDEPPSTNGPRKYSDRSDRTHDIKRSTKQQPTMVNRRQQQSNKMSGNSNENWETLRSFKTTKIEVKEGVEKQINDIRICLNKISNKNYDAQKTVILEQMRGVGDYAIQIATAIFDIASSNKFYSEIYADLYHELMQEFSVFRDVIHDVVVKYTSSIDHIHYVDPNIDYDGFCAFTKTNDSRRAMALFIINLMKKGVLERGMILDIIIQLEDLVFKYADEDNRTNELEEITENVFLFVSQCKTVFVEEPTWGQVLEKINVLSQYKVKEHSSFTSRAMFKYMDLCK